MKCVADLLKIPALRTDVQNDVLGTSIDAEETHAVLSFVPDLQRITNVAETCNGDQVFLPVVQTVQS